MSRIGKQIIKIPEKVEVTATAGKLSVAGPLGALSRPLPAILIITINNGEVTLKPERDNVATRALWGTYASHLINMIEGVTKGFQKKLIIEGVGFRATVTGAKMTLNLGLSHPVNLPIPTGLKVTVEKNLVSISGFDKELVGQFAATVRAYKEPEPYKGKGIRYEGEIIRRKEGKKVVS
jgi:large subunit ribosomal protein L6